METQWVWSGRLLAQPSLLGLANHYGMELIHPVRRGRSPQQFGRASISNHRWTVGAKRCQAVNHLGKIIGWVWGAANTYDCLFHPSIEVPASRSVLLSDTGFHAQAGDPPTLKLCRRGA